MPIQAPGKQTIREVARNWQGVNLRQDPTDIGPNALAAATNVDLYEMPGVICSRRGINPVSTGLEPIRFLIRTPDGQLMSAGRENVYVLGASVYAELSQYYRVFMAQYKGQQTPTSEIFIANGINRVGTYNMFRYGRQFGNFKRRLPRGLYVCSQNSEAIST
jgi:hypothetical protein